jgi:hypothetical protein
MLSVVRSIHVLHQSNSNFLITRWPGRDFFTHTDHTLVLSCIFILHLEAMLLHSLAVWLSLGSLALSSPLQARTLDTSGLSTSEIDEFPSFDEIVKRQDGACTNTPRTRSCWSLGYSIATDFDAKQPPDGTTVTVSIRISTIKYICTNSSAVQL